MTATMAFAETNPSLRSTPLSGRLPPLTAAPEAGDNVILDCIRSGRFGLRGAGTLDWLAAQDLPLPEDVNTALTLADGTTLLRLGQQEMMMTDPIGAGEGRAHALRQAWRDSTLPAKGYDAYRDEGWAWFVISGPFAPQMMARISMTDLRPKSLGVGGIAQTRALHQDAVVTRSDRFGAVSYDIFFDIASAAFALEVLSETASGIGEHFTLSEWRGRA
ncbi:MAG: hypothetical protein ABS76_00835 [Pelagibacterium sp. SCN 64-44]|nr:MAG: hypothetical protein ABS76_00835 [Pelagibacterium sp. SCN 64-44]